MGMMICKKTTFKDGTWQDAIFLAKVKFRITSKLQGGPRADR